MTGNNPKLYLVNIDEHKKIGQILSICSDINQNMNFYTKFEENWSIYAQDRAQKQNFNINQRP